MAFKGTWQRAENDGNSSSNDRRYGLSSDSFSGFSSSSQVANNQMGLSGMNYSNNNNSLFNPITSSSTNNPQGNKAVSYKGTISNVYRDSAVIDNEISFKLSSVNGAAPRVGDRVICQMKQTESYGNATPYKYFGFDVRILQNPLENRRNPRPSSNSQSMGRNSENYPHRNRNGPSNEKRNLATNSRDRPASTEKNGNGDRRRPSPPRRSQKNLTAKRDSRGAINKYFCSLPKGNLDCFDLNVTQIRTRYPRLHIPSDFFHASFDWQKSIPFDRPLKFFTPCSFHLFHKTVPRPVNHEDLQAEPSDLDYSWNVRVLLMSSPDIQTMIARSCLLHQDPNKKLSTDPDDFEHPSKLIKFLVALRNQNEYLPIGGSWSQQVDGPNPESDPQVLIRTAIRCVRTQTGIDLSQCIRWFRFLEVRYHRPEEVHKGRLIESRVENVVVFLPEISNCMPTSLEWEETVKNYKKACDDEIAEELNEISFPDEQIQDDGPTDHKALELDRLRTIDLRRELKVRSLSLTGIKSDLKKRLSMAIEIEKNRENSGENSNVGENTDGTTNSMKIEVKETSTSDVEKLRKEIQMKYQISSQRSIVVHPANGRPDKFDCRVVSLHYLLNYANKDTIKEKSFELYLFIEAFFEMLQRDHAYRIYRSLFSCLELTESNVDENPAEPQTISSENTENVERQDQQDDPEENGKKRKRSPSKDENSNQRKKSLQEETRPRTVQPDLLLSFTFFDRNRSGYLAEKDLEEILLLSGLSLTKNEVKMLVSRVSQDEKVRYHKLTDKLLSIEKINETNEILLSENEIDSQTPRGNLPFLLSNSLRNSTRENEEQRNNDSGQIFDHQRAMKQLEMSTQIQTGLELKIDALKNEIQILTDELNSSQKNARNFSEQLNESRKRLRENQHDFKELEEKSKKYSDALYRVRNESRSTLDYLSHLLGSKDKQNRKSEDENKKKKDENEPSDEISETTSDQTNKKEE